MLLTMLRLSNSKTEMFMHSERCFWWRYIRKIYPRASNAALTWGSAVHTGLEWLYHIDIDNADSVMDILYQSDDKAIYNLERLEREGSHFTPERLRMMLNAYDEKYDDDWEILDIEIDTICPLSNSVEWQGILDLVVRRSDGLVYFVDHKTTAKKVDSSYYSAGFDNSQQMTSYTWMGHMLYGDEFGGIIINAAQSTKTIPYKFARFPIVRDDWQLEQFVRHIEAIAPRIQDCEEFGPIYLERGRNEEDSEVLHDFPMRWTYSENFCDYQHLNNCMPEMRPALIEQLYTTER